MSDKGWTAKQIMESLRRGELPPIRIDSGEDVEKMFHEGQLVVYQNGDKVELGKIKVLFEDCAFVWYHNGETAARTDLKDLKPLVNEYCVRASAFGGETNRLEDALFKIKAYCKERSDRTRWGVADGANEFGAEKVKDSILDMLNDAGF